MNRYQFRSPEHPNFVQELGDDSPSASAWGLATCEQLRAALRPGEELKCYQSTPPGAAGMWVLTTFPRQSVGDSLHWRLSYVGAVGNRIHTPRFEAGDGGDPAMPNNHWPTLATVLSVVDYDGDGKQEVLTGVSRYLDAAGNLTDILRVWTAGPRQVEPFAATQQLRILSARDWDRDGRFELVVDPYELRLGSEAGWVESRELWSLLVEISAGGKVIADGPASRGYARKLCPSPTELLDALGQLDDYACVAGYIHCSRLWAIPTDDILAAVEKLCPPAKQHDSGWCAHSLNAWQTMARATLPFTLEP